MGRCYPEFLKDDSATMADRASSKPSPPKSFWRN